MVVPPARPEDEGPPAPADRAAADAAAWDVPAFLRLVTHDLRAPLASARTMLSVLSQGHLGDLQPPQADVLRRVERRLESLQALVDDLIDLASVRAGKDVRRSADICAAVREATALFADRARTLGIALALEGTGAVVQVAMAPSDLEVVLHHLLDNAIKYGGERDVRVAVERLGEQARLVVADGGIGIPDEARRHLFEPFFRAAGARAVAEGSGLGLAIVKEAVERCAGQVEIESSEGAGTTVIVRLPLARGDETACSTTGW